MIFELSDEIGFPDPRLGEEDGFFAIGGDLSEERLLLAYEYGIFPWYSFKPEEYPQEMLEPKTGKPRVQWWCPMQRFVIFPSEIHISHSMRQMLNKAAEGEYKVTFNQAFEQVINQCGVIREDEQGAWLGEDIKKAYTQLHKRGYAMSVEVWDKEETLIGGLYGVTMGKVFIGESMFSLKPSASKLALIALARVLSPMSGSLIDCQLETSHLKSMGGRYIPYEEYLKILHPGRENILPELEPIDEE